MTLKDKDFDELLERARRIDQNALAEIHDRFYSEVYRYVYFRLNDASACEDITSEVFLRLLDALNRRKGPRESLRGWLMGTASNLVNDHLRQRYADRVDNLEDGDQHLADESSPEDVFDETWQQKQVIKAIQQLTEEQQNVLALRFAEGRSLDETARMIGKSVTAVKALQFRALASLRRLLEKK